MVIVSDPVKVPPEIVKPDIITAAPVLNVAVPLPAVKEVMLARLVPVVKFTAPVLISAALRRSARNPS